MAEQRPIGNPLQHILQRAMAGKSVVLGKEDTRRLASALIETSNLRQHLEARIEELENPPKKKRWWQREAAE